MNIPLSFKDTFGLIIEPRYASLVEVANNFHPGVQYSTIDIFKALESKYRKSHTSQKKWLESINKTFDKMIEYGLMDQKDGYFYRTKMDYYRKANQR